jgi:ABC-type branched-subunit amino acid transport system ATPase component/branched-subunit amino acid ABC-type transport system permease component
MDKLLTIVLSGIVSGTIYSLIASGLVLARSTSGIFNFAHGAVAFASAYLFYELNTGAHLSPWLSAVLAAGVMPVLLGLLLNRIVFRHLAGASEEAKVVATVGLMIALPALSLWIVELLNNNAHLTLPTGENVFIAPGLGPVPKQSWRLTNTLVLDSNQLVVLATSLVVAVVLWLVVRHTRLGLRMRAGIDRQELASLRGIDPVRTASVAWSMSMVLAGLAGVVGAPIFGLGPATYTTVLFVAAAAAVLAGLRSIPIAFVAGVGLGVLQNVVVGYAPFAQKITGLGATVPFIVLLVAIWFLGRDRGRKAGTATESSTFEDYLDDLPMWRRMLPWAVVSAALLIYLMFVADRFWAGIIATGVALGMVFLSFVVVTGLGGMVSLAQASFVSVGAVTAGLLLAHHTPYPLAVLGGGIAAVVLGLIVAAPGIRLGGVAFALATLALAFIVDQVGLKIDSFGGGVVGRQLIRPNYGWIDLGNDKVFAVVLLVLVMFVVWLVGNLQKSASGRAIGAVRSSELGATAAGISQVRAKIGLFVVSAAIAGIGGALLASVDGQVTPNSYPAATGLLWLAVAVTFGVRRPIGAVLAGILFAAGPEIIGWFTTSTRIPTILFGLGAVNLAANPEGSVAQIGRMLRAVRDRRRRRKGTGAVSLPGSPVPGELGSTDLLELPTSMGALVNADRAYLMADDDGAVPLLKAVDIRAGYGSVNVLHDVSINLYPGSITAILGANGSGKSTLCKAIAGSVVMTHGSLTMAGRDITTRAAHVRARQGIILAPESRGIFPGLTVAENLDVWLPAKTDVAKALDRFPALARRVSLLAGSLSGGEQQMLALAPLLIRTPDVLIVDEPSLGLAPLIVAELFGLFEELRDAGCALLVVEEKSTDALRIADRVVIMEGGHAVWNGPARALDEQTVASAYLGVTTS